jgi:hypothetical protein
MRTPEGTLGLLQQSINGADWVLYAGLLTESRRQEDLAGILWTAGSSSDAAEAVRDALERRGPVPAALLSRIGRKGLTFEQAGQLAHDISRSLGGLPRALIADLRREVAFQYRIAGYEDLEIQGDTAAARELWESMSGPTPMGRVNLVKIDGRWYVDPSVLVEGSSSPPR